MKRTNFNKDINIRSLIIDSGPLLIALVTNYLRMKQIKNKRQYIENAWDKFSQSGLSILQIQNFFEDIHEFYTTPHAIGELIGLVKSRLNLTTEQINDFWAISINYLIAKNINERFISIINFYNCKNQFQIIQKIGFIDSELINLSMQIRIPILTTDNRTLKFEAAKKEVDVLVFDDDIFNFLY